MLSASLEAVLWSVSWTLLLKMTRTPCPLVGEQFPKCRPAIVGVGESGRLCVGMWRIPSLGRGSGAALPVLCPTHSGLALETGQTCFFCRFLCRVGVGGCFPVRPPLAEVLKYIRNINH